MKSTGEREMWWMLGNEQIRCDGWVEKFRLGMAISDPCTAHAEGKVSVMKVEKGWVRARKINFLEEIVGEGGRREMIVMEAKGNRCQKLPKLKSSQVPVGSFFASFQRESDCITYLAWSFVDRQREL